MKPIPVAVLQCFAGLAERWEDEQQYEDFVEYQNHMKANLPAGAELQSMTKRPFKVVFVWEGARRFMRATRTEVVYGTLGVAK